MNYKQANELLTGRCHESKKLENNTYLQRRGESIVVKLHSTDIITMQKNGVNVLNSGGWKTSTVKDRLNAYSGVRINQVKGRWYIGEYLYYDGIKIKDRQVIGKKQSADKKQDKLDKMIKAYCNEVKALEKLPEPNNGDCWGCLFGMPGKDHLIEHLKEKYIHGSLIFNALKDAGYAHPEFIFQMDVRSSIVRAVRKYFKRQLGIAY